MNFIILALLGVIIFIIPNISAPMAFKHTYCCMKCGKSHVMCKYPKPGPGPDCSVFVGSGLTNEQRQIILDTHNELRNYVASGQFKKYPAPSSDMMELEWDDELELFANRLAEQCLPFKGDECRDSIRFKVGQNYASGFANALEGQKLPTIEQMIRKDWFGNHEYCGTEKQYCAVYEDAYFYTQLTWGNTFKVGCSYSEFNETKTGLMRSILVCNYAPMGNTLDQAPYVRGKPCTACSNGTTCSTRFTSLCAEAVRIKPNRNYLFIYICVLHILHNLLLSVIYRIY